MAVHYDVALFQPGSPYVVQALDVVRGGRRVSGREKLAQRFLVELLTPRGSLVYRPNRGTAFASRVGNGNALSEFDAFVAFGQGLHEAGVNLQSEEAPGDPPEERFAGAQLVSLVVTADVLVLQVAVASQAGGVTSVSVPLAVGSGD